MSSISLSLTIYILSLLSYYPAEMVVIKLPYTVPPSPLHLSSLFNSPSHSLPLMLLDIPHWSDTQRSLHRQPSLALSFMYFFNDNTVAVMYCLAAPVSAAQSLAASTDG